MKITDTPVGSSIIVDVERGVVYLTLSSKISDHKDKGILIYPPYDKHGQIQGFKETDTIYVRYVRQNKVYQWKCFNWKYITEHIDKLIYLESNESSENGNRRGALRVDLKMKTEIRNTKDLKKHEIETRDISQTGLSFICDKVIPNNETFDLELRDMEITMPIRIKIVRMEERPNGNLYGALIIKSDQQLRKYISQKQVLEIKKLQGLEM